MNLQEVMSYLEEKGSDKTRNIYKKHGAPEKFFGVKVTDLKPIQKQEKNNHTLALELFETMNGDAQYLAGLIADPKQFTENLAEKWAKKSTWYMVAEYAVAWNIAETNFCEELCEKWINSKDVKLQQVAWASLSAYLMVKPNEQINKNRMQRFLDKVENEIHSSENRVRYTMNGFVIALGGAIPEFTLKSKKVGMKIGKVIVNMGDTACKVPEIVPYIEKMEKMNRIGKKKKTAKC